MMDDPNHINLYEPRVFTSTFMPSPALAAQLKGDSISFSLFDLSAAKRQQTDQAKFRTMTIWFLLALLVIFAAIPWPFSPLANRPYFHLF